MSYEPTVWKDGDLVTSAKLNKIEEGVLSNNNKMLHIVEFPGALMIPDATWQEIYENNFTTFIYTDFYGKSFYRLKEIYTDKISNLNYLTLTINNSSSSFVTRDINDYPVYSYIPPFISIPSERRVTDLVDSSDSTYTVEDIQSSIEFFQDPRQQYDGGVVFNVYGTLNSIYDSDTGGFQNVLVIQKNSEINREGLQLDVLYQDKQTEAIESENIGLLQDINYIKVFDDAQSKTIGFKIYSPSDNNLIRQTYFIKCIIDDSK